MEPHIKILLREIGVQVEVEVPAVAAVADQRGQHGWVPRCLEVVEAVSVLRVVLVAGHAIVLQLISTHSPGVAVAGDCHLHQAVHQVVPQEFLPAVQAVLAVAAVVLVAVVLAAMQVPKPPFVHQVVAVDLEPQEVQLEQPGH